VSQTVLKRQNPELQEYIPKKTKKFVCGVVQALRHPPVFFNKTTFVFIRLQTTNYMLKFKPKPHKPRKNNQFTRIISYI